MTLKLVKDDKDIYTNIYMYMLIHQNARVINNET